MLVIPVAPARTRTPLLSPDVGATLTVHRMTDGDEDKLAPVYDGIVIDREVIGHANKRDTTVWEVVRLWILVGDGRELGEYILHGRTQQRMFSELATRPLGELPREDRDRVVRYWLGAATSAEKRRASRDVIDAATRALEIANDDDRGRALYLRAIARADLREHEAALADLEALLALRPAHQGAIERQQHALIALGRMPPPDPPQRSSDRVEHPTYGEGRILRRLEGGKLEIEFASGKKTLLARFVETLP